MLRCRGEFARWGEPLPAPVLRLWAAVAAVVLCGAAAAQPQAQTQTPSSIPSPLLVPATSAPPELPLAPLPQTIDWALRRIEVEGMALAPASWDGMAARRLASEKMARADVARLLLAQVGGLQVSGRGAAGRAGGRMAADPALHGAIVQRLARADELAVRFFSDGGVSLRAALSLEAVSDLLLHGARAPPAPRATLPAATVGQGAYTGLVIDAQAVDFPPRLRLLLVDPSGRVFFDASAATRLAEGPVAWVRQTSQALRQARVGYRPLWLRAVAVGIDADTLVVAELSGTEASALAPQLAQGRLVVVW